MDKKPINLNQLVKVSVSQLENKNQFVIYYKDSEKNYVCFQSYRTLIAIYSYNKLYINWSYWDYSKTTSKHLKIFINEYTNFKYEDKKQFLKLIVSDDRITLFDE